MTAFSVLLTTKKEKAAAKRMDYRKNVYYILMLLKKEIKSLLVLLFFLFGIGIISYLLPSITQHLLDQGFLVQDESIIIHCSVKLLFLYLILALLTLLKNYKQSVLMYNVQRKLMKESFEQLLHIEYSYFGNQNITSLYKTLEEDIEVISGIFGEEVLLAFSGLFMAVGGGIALFSINKTLGLIALLYIPIKLIFTKCLSKKAFLLTCDYINKQKNFADFFADVIMGIKEVRVFGLADRERHQIDDKQHLLMKTAVTRGVFQDINNQGEMVITQILITVIYIVSSFLLKADSITVGGIIAFTSYALMISDPISGVIDIIYGAALILPSVERHLAFLEYPKENDENKKIYSYTNDTLIKEQRLAFRDMSFSYKENIPIFEHVNLEIAPGEHVAIMGENGAGKTTLLNLIVRLFKPDSGAILINNADIYMFDIKQYRQKISVLSQDYYIFNDTIINNICLYREYDKETLDNILDALRIKNLIARFGENGVLGNNGSKVSGGQRQRIALARTLINKKPIMIFDEPHSQLDSEAIKGLLQLFNSYLKDSTIICVTHSKEFAAHFDVIYKVTKNNILKV